MPGFSEVHANLALLLERAGQDAEAEAHYRIAIACAPDQGQTHLNFGVLLTRQKRFAEAEALYRQALALMPTAPAAWTNLGILQACLQEESAAEDSYRTALTLDPAHRLAAFNLSYLLLRQGRFEEGWRRFEARPWYERLQSLLPCPRWQGEALTGKFLLIGIEAGHGDMIQFCRYAPLLKARGAAHIGLICHPALKTLLATLDGVDTIIALDESLPACTWDYWVPPLSLPLHCQTRLDNMPAALPYLHADPDKTARWAERLHLDALAGQRRIGLVWKGNPHFENDADRSLPSLATLAPIAHLDGIRLICLQKGSGEAEAEQSPAGLSCLNLGPQLGDFADTAAVISQLDLLISVDTAVAHLAGALGKPCWLLLPAYKTDWRWLTGRDDSPWYPGTLRLFRQNQPGDWGPVVREVRTALERWLAAPAPAQRPKQGATKE